ncbi:MAG: hypothetical protein AABW89_01680 [Nanoarchaeota archaeon]
MKKKGELTFDTLIPWIIALGALFLIILLIVASKGKGEGIINYLKDLWRFGG